MSQCIDLFPWDKRAEKGLDNDSRDLRMFWKGNAGNSSGSKVYSGQTNPNVLKPLSSDSDTCLHGIRREFPAAMRWLSAEHADIRYI